MKRWQVCCEFTHIYELIAALQAQVDSGGGGGGGSGDFTYLPSVTGYTGGGASKLDGVTTVGVSVGLVYGFDHATDGGRLYVLLAGTTAENSPNIIRPDDYNGITNIKYWKSFL